MTVELHEKENNKYVMSFQMADTGNNQSDRFLRGDYFTVSLICHREHRCAGKPPWVTLGTSHCAPTAVEDDHNPVCWGHSFLKSVSSYSWQKACYYGCIDGFRDMDSSVIGYRYLKYKAYII